MRKEKFEIEVTANLKKIVEEDTDLTHEAERELIEYIYKAIEDYITESEALEQDVILRSDDAEYLPQEYDSFIDLGGLEIKIRREENDG